MFSTVATIRNTSAESESPQTAQHAGQDVVRREADDPQEKDVEVIGAPVQNRRGRVEHREQRARHERPNHHNDDGREQRQRHAVADDVRQVVPFLRAEILRYQNSRARRNADEQRQQQVQDWGRAADGGKGVIPHIDTHDDRIRRVVHLLGQVADQHRQGKFQDPFPGRAQRHILRGKQAFEPSSACSRIHVSSSSITIGLTAPPLRRRGIPSVYRIPVRGATAPTANS